MLLPLPFIAFFGFFNFYNGLKFSDYQRFFLDASLYLGRVEYTSNTLGEGLGAYLFAGVPAPVEGQRVRVVRNSAYWVGYSRSKRTPLWAAYRLARVDKQDTVPRPDSFIADFRVFPPTGPATYTHSGYDRGHMVPNYAISTFYPRHVQSTFLMTNIIPQKPELNRQVWQRLERRIAREYAERFEEVWVLMGPVFKEEVASRVRTVAIPDKFFKIIIVVDKEKNVQIESYLIPQNVRGGESIDSFITTVARVEELTGFILLPEWPTVWEGFLTAEKRIR